VKARLFSVGEHENLELLPAVAVLFAAPWLMGLRPSRARIGACIPFALVASIMMLMPSFALNTAFLYERFALFLLPAYAWMFAAVPTPELRGPAWRRGARWVMPVVMACCWAVLAVHAVRAWRFGQEAGGFDAAVDRLEPRQRALMLVFNGSSYAAHNPFLYIQYGAWYQAEREGMMDFNFAWFPPQIVRFRPQHVPPWHPGLEWKPARFDWTTYHGANYRYFFVRNFGPLPANLFRGADCAPAPIWSGDGWTIFERRACP